jgi:transcriptional regulator with XRE-family HTH domain
MRRDNSVSYLGGNIKRLRKRKGLTIKELSELCNSSVSGISQIETGKRDVTFGLILKIANALEIDVSELVASPEKVPFEHKIGLSIKFSDYFLVIGYSTRTHSELYSWSAVFDLSEGRLIEVIHFNYQSEMIIQEDFINSILIPFITEQRILLLMKSFEINNSYDDIKGNGMDWNDLKFLLVELEKNFVSSVTERVSNSELKQMTMDGRNQIIKETGDRGNKL